MNARHIAIAIIALVCLLGSSHLQAANPPDKSGAKGYRFVLTIKNNHDSIMYLGNYYAGKTYAIDTARIDKKGRFVFERKNMTLFPGMYFFTNPAGNYVEFMVHNEKPDFTFATEESSWSNHLTVKGSKENEYFIAYQKAYRNAHHAIDTALRSMGAQSEEFVNFRRRTLLQLDSTVATMIAAHPNSMIALMMNATREPQVPSLDAEGNKLTNRQRWEYYMEHYFDNTRLDDEALVRTPNEIFIKRLNFYLDSCLHNASAEMICEYVDKVIEKARPAKENFRYLVHSISEKYLQSPVMSYDAVYVHLVKKYVETGECFWMSPSTVDYNVKRANTWDKLLLGRTAPELIMKDHDGNFHSLHQQKHKYTLLIFWSPTCGHCKVMIPSLYKMYEHYRDKYDIGAYAVLSEPDEETRPKWLEFIENYKLQWINVDGGEANIDWHEVYDVITTPQIFLLDQDKKILAKKLNAESFEMVIKALENE
jgi:thiol-disulfide isomerase/thioredoxin